MTHTVEYSAGEHKRVGPYTDVHGHAPVTVIQDDEVHDVTTDDGVTLWVCLDCGFVTVDRRKMKHAECDRGENLIAQTWRERIEADGFPE